MVFFLFICFYVFFFTKIIKYETNIPSNTTEITAKLISFSIDGDKLSMLLKKKEKINATYYIKSEEEKNYLENNLLVGEILKLNGKQKEIIGRTIPNTFDYKKYLYNEKIYFSFSVSKLEIIDDNIDFLNTIKNKVEERLQKLGNNSYLRAFIIGDKTLIDNDQYENIMKNGVSHLFALSGMHLSFVYLFLSKLLNKFKYKKIMIYSFLFLYLFITGFSVSFFRAILFMILLDLNKKLEIKLSKIKILFITAFVLLIINPFYIYNVGFWYTFVVTFSLLFCSSIINKQNKIIQIVLVSTITFLFSLPISIYINYEINLLSILNNIILVPFISTFVFPLALLSFLLPIFLPIFNLFVSVLENMNVFFSSFAIILIFGKINLIEVFLYYFILILGIELRLKKIFVLLILFLIFLYNKNLFNFDYSVYFIDVGQGDSTLFVAPYNKEVIMIDTGGAVTYPKKDYQIRNKEFNLTDNIVLFLKSICIRKIDLLLITHGDQDHLGYASDIGESIPIKNVMINHGEINKKENELIQKYNRVEKYNSRVFDFQTYFMSLYDNENDNSILTKIKIHNQTFLLMGDASTNVEAEFMSKYNINATFLKLGHHGSKTSSSKEFIDYVNPKYSIISVGRNNRYGHPNKEVLDNVKNSKIYRTDQVGSIIVKINKKDLTIKTCMP